MIRSLIVATAVTIGCLAWVPPAPAYVDLAPTLARIVRESGTITVAEVDRFSRDKGAVILKKGPRPQGRDGRPTRSSISCVRANESAHGPADPGMGRTGRPLRAVPHRARRPSSAWARAGIRSTPRTTAGGGSACRARTCRWPITARCRGWPTPIPLMRRRQERRHHDAAARGRSGRGELRPGPEPGQSAGTGEGAAHPRQPADAGHGDGRRLEPGLGVGPGRAEREDVPALREKLRSTDATVRAESAADLGFLGADGAEAAGDLAKLARRSRAVPVRLAAARRCSGSSRATRRP